MELSLQNPSTIQARLADERAAADEAILTVGGVEFSGWEGVRVDRALDAAAGVFQLDVFTRERPPIKLGNKCSLRLGRPGGKVQAGLPGPELADPFGEVLVTGQVDLVRAQLDAEGGRLLTVGGRDYTGDLVDCSALNEPGEWRDVPLRSILQAIADPFEVVVVLEQGFGFGLELNRIVPYFAISRGEKAWEAIERLCRMRGLLVTGDGFGRVVVTTAGVRPAVGELVEGLNVLTATLEQSDGERFRHYIVDGQDIGDDVGWGAQVAEIQGRALDEGIVRNRPLLIVAEGVVDPAIAKERAEWERTVRAARSDVVSVTVRGWRQTPGGRPWLVNELVPLLIPSIGVRGTLLVNAVTYVRGAKSGTTATLELVRPGSYKIEPLPPEQEDPLEQIDFEEFPE